MIFVKQIGLQFGSQVVFDDISCTIMKEDRVGLVGRNGTGKSTFLKVLDGLIGIDRGTIEIQRGAKIAYMPQEMVIKSDKNVLDETLSALERLYNMEQEKNKLFAKIQDDPTEHDMIRYAELEHELMEQNFEYKKVQAQKMLIGLGFDEAKQKMSVDQLSVGWRMRIVLAKLLLQDADFYLFDEPTNHLDLSAKNWFLNFLKNGDFGYMLVCHDRYFLDKACNKTFELSMGNLTVYYGNYSYFVEQKRIRTEFLEQAYEQQQREIKQKEDTINRFRASATKSAMAQSMIKALDKIERIKIEPKIKTISLKLAPPARSGQYVLTVKDVSFGFTKQLFKNVSFEIQRGEKVALIAPNGTGKSTLFNLIAEKLKLTHGSIELGHQVITSLFDQDQEKVLDPKKTIFEEVVSSCPQATEAQIRTVLGAFLFSGDDVHKLTKVLSGGERNRVAMSKIILSKANFFLLDEPTNHLDIESKEVILQALKNYEGTILFVSHDQDFVNKLSTKIIELDVNGVTPYFGNYDNYLDTKNAVFKMRGQDSVTQSEKKESTGSNKPESKKEQYELSKKFRNLENKIKQLEQKKPEILNKMGLVAYGSDEYQVLNQELDKVKKTLEVAGKEWEEVARKLDRDIS
ncbi:ABC-F family ATP-binding cassette domain-containing protein [Candidatus Babeliales bacterium]|nr:ABC-F family ATP-binding cassette domain-containing protein [Candidatus Babeliales bacterium]